MHPRRTADVAFPKHTFALRNCGQLFSGAGGLSVSLCIFCLGWAKIDGEKQTLNVAMSSQDHLIHLLRSLPYPGTGYPPPSTPMSHAWVEGHGDPGGLSWSQVLMDLQSHVAGIPSAFPAVFCFSAECWGPISCFTPMLNLLNQDSMNWFRPGFWWLMPGTPFLLGSSSSSVLPSPVPKPVSYRTGAQMCCFPPLNKWWWIRSYFRWLVFIYTTVSISSLNFLLFLKQSM